jgi:peptidoglycan/xylan/chitin deacetylase (PgdA/CDA1 family)
MHEPGAASATLPASGTLRASALMHGRLRLRRWQRATAAALFVALVGCFAVWRLMNSLSYQVAGDIVQDVQGPEKVVALTFDDGPVPDRVEPLLSILREEQVRATFFVIGEAVAEHPDSARKLVAAGHQLGNHSYTHRRMIFRSGAFYVREIEETDAQIRAVGFPGPIVFRPPYGKKLVGLPQYLAATGRTTVTWGVQPEADSGPPRPAAEVVSHVLARTYPGAIILLHPWYPGGEETRQAIRPVIQGLKQQGYRFVTVNELLALRP